MLSLAMLLLPGCTQPEDPPSVIVIVIDTLRRDHMSLYGYPRNTTPGLERLGTESAVFERCLAPSSWTKPSTVSLLSGMYPARHKTDADRAASTEIEFLAEILHERGYQTAAFSGNPHVSPMSGLDQGFDAFAIGSETRAANYPDIAEILAGARNWLDESSGPSFLYLHLMNVHGPYRAPESYQVQMDRTPRRPFEFRNPIWQAIMEHGRFEQRRRVTAAHLNDLRTRYDAAIAYTDAELTRFIDGLRNDRILDRTLLVITADHGEEIFEHKGFGHRRTLHSEVLDIPLLIRPPGGSDGRRIQQSVSLVDVPATVLDWVGALGGQTSFRDGISLAPSIESESEIAPRLLLAQLDDSAVGRLIERWPYRLIQMDLDYEGHENTVELFDLESDPNETTDLSRRHRGAVESLTALDHDRMRELRSDAFDAPRAQIDEDTARRLDALGYGKR